MLSKDDGFDRALFTRQKRDFYSNIMVPCHSNPFLDTPVYEFQFKDESIREYADNIISENLYSLTDSDNNE